MMLEVFHQRAKDIDDEEAYIIRKGDISKATASPVFTMNFVNMNAVSQAEKQRNQKIIRSTAMKCFRRKQQLQRAQEGREQNGGKAAAKQPCPNPQSSDHSDEEGRSPGSSNGWSSEAILSDISVDFRIGESSEGGAISSPSPIELSPSVGPITPLGAGRIDPFRSSSDDNCSLIHELIDHCITIVWPGFCVRGPEGGESKMPSAWLMKTYKRPVVMHAMLFGAAVHLEILRKPRMKLDDPIRLFHKIQTMQLLKEELKRPEKIILLDDVILAVLALGTNEVETMANNISSTVRSPFNSPLSCGQWLNVYGSMSHVPEHGAAMLSLVSRRGGLEMIESDGLAEVLSFSDILGATQQLTKPIWPLLRRTLMAVDETPKLLSGKIGKGFQALVGFGINNNAANVLQSMAKLTLTIDSHCRGIKLIADLPIFIATRNAIQHSLMSLPTGYELEGGEIRSICLYESIRLAAVIYSVGITFPLPPISGIFRKLAGLLKMTMEKSKFDPCWQLCPKTLLWILILGGIAASETVDRIWYVQNLAALSRILKLSTWEQVAEEVRNYLWLDSACESGGRSLWNEMNNM